MLLPPAAGYARQYAFAQALQFVIFAVAGPALLVLGTPRRTRSPDRPSGRSGRPHRPGARATIALAAFIAAAITWRLPVTVNALARDPALAAAEMITLLAAGRDLAGADRRAARTGAAAPPGTRRHGSSGHVDDLGARLPHRDVRRVLVRRLSPRRARRPGRRRGPADRRGYLVGRPGAVLPAFLVRHGRCLAGRRRRRERAPAASGSTPAGWPRPPQGWRSPHSR